MRGILLTACFLVPAAAPANVGPPWRGGDLTGDPVGIIDVDITRETLTLDMRPLAHGGLAEVEAIYRLHNRGATKTLDLVFASGSAKTANFRVWLGDAAIDSQPVQGMKMPASWEPPTHTPQFSDVHGWVDLGYHLHQATPIAFVVTIPPGPQELKVRYAAEAVQNLNGTPTLIHQFAYVLAPARSWSSFGGLDVTVHVPAGWNVAARPKLDRDGDTLRASFSEVPDDALTLTLQAPASWLYRLLGCASLAVAVGGAAICWRGGRNEAESSSRLERWTRSLGLAVLWGIAFSAAGAFATFGLDWTLPAGQASHYGYDQSLAMIGYVALSVLLVPIGFVIARLGAARAPLNRDNDIPTQETSP
jgi:hypothetical protein